MSNGGKQSIRIDWFDGSLVEDARPSTSLFDDEEQTQPEQKLPQTEKKPIGFKRLQDISLMKPPILILEVSNRPGFWNLFDQDELKGDFIVLIVRILANVIKDIQPGERSKIVKMLETRFLSSNFLDKLIEYINGLPYVKIVEKRMNAQLWDDIQDFYFKILDLCDGLSHIFSGKSEGLNKKLQLLLEDLCKSAIGVAQEHSEQFSEELFERIQRLQTEVDIEELVSETCALKSISDPNSFKNLKIFPTLHDLIPHQHANDQSINREKLESQNVTIRPNIINGAYPNVEHYLDVQFKLLREDYLGPLREGICKYLENPSKRKHENIRVYPQVRVIRTYVSNNKVGHLIDIAWKERTSQMPIKKSQYHKKLMFGSLVLFTSDAFHNILCATVLDSSLELLKDGYLAVSFQNPVSKNILSEAFLMVESEVFFEPYHQVLKVLQDSRMDKLPMEKYIVDVKPETKPPTYLNNETIYTLKGHNKSEIPFPVLDTNQWPSKDLGLDESQLDAFKFALTREFAVIQGPPGTGKTFLGVKIASIILQNLSLEGTPMLILCYTNHALDQFLEGILSVTNSIVRLGSQSKSEKLENYSLGAVRAKVKCKYSYLYGRKRAELEAIYKDMSELQTDIEKCEQGILSYNCIKPYLKVNGKERELKHSDEDRVLNWLFEHLEHSKSHQKIEEDSWENIDSDTNEGKIETCFTESSALKEVDSLRSAIRHVDDNKESFNNPEAVQKFHSEVNKINKRLECFQSNIKLYSNSKEQYKIENVDDLHILNTCQRWQLYFNAMNELKNQLLNKMDVLLEKHNTVNTELEEVSTLIDGEVLRTARVVGATTTAAARRHKLLDSMQSPIVIVEEAAEVLEAHIIASLTNKCQHLILIGDHKQLRPTAANYKLSQHYNMDVSLFERMIRNGIHARTLTTQRRMRPDFVELLVPQIYERLDSHPNVYKYPDVKGLAVNFYFFSHVEFEDSEVMEDSWSHQNPFEANRCIALANLLRKHYEPDDITILTTYTGQVTLIKKLSHKFELLKDVKITSVDNFQGEESRIVILSLVRSNREGNIGFLSAANRVCVALSRAKEGFYIFGNMSMLSAASPLWSTIHRQLKGRNAIGDRSTWPLI